MPRHNHRDPDDLTPAQIIILEVIGWWYNAVPIQLPDGSRTKIGETQPPEIFSLLRAYKGIDQEEWESTYKPAYERLVTENWLKSTCLYKRQISWAPGRDARKFLDEHLAQDDNWAGYVPDYYNYTGGLVGDLNESLTHRFGVELTRNALEVWGYTSIEMYPGDGSQRRCDIHAVKDGVGWAAEILCWHRDYEAYLDKYRHTSQSGRNIFYVFQNRKLANQCINWWVEHDEIELDVKNYPLNPNQRAMENARTYLRKSVKGAEFETPGISDMETITRLYKQMYTIGDK
ncbi:hypothetical protein [Halobellus sp. EA9]|uniref:hypothetical protein n=1 Tax=Halobellus sp. EA9 TaxID=3421647 RepID=UPI003EB776ED